MKLYFLVPIPNHTPLLSSSIRIYKCLIRPFSNYSFFAPEPKSQFARDFLRFIRFNLCGSPKQYCEATWKSLRNWNTSKKRKVPECCFVDFIKSKCG
ncbi:hypothetical protein CW304_27805 [Bacillus sp. UFRGS-B20]|nr:hypothetical protein CW304_27805 [Bacillus sp. UFRGS-B20]